MAAPSLTAEQTQQLKAIEGLATQFTQFYYQKFDTNRAELAELYNANAIMSFEGTIFIGPAAILEKLKSLPFQAIQHIVTTIDSHPVEVGGTDPCVLVTVVGQLKTDDDRPHSFSQAFVLKQIAGSFQICNDIFRLALHHGGVNGRLKSNTKFDLLQRAKINPPN